MVIGVVVACIALYCCLRCCGCCGGRRSSRKNNQPSMFNPMPYQGYQPANSNVAPPAYGQAPAQYAQFDNSNSHGYRGAGKAGEDSLPAMPSWTDARDTRVEEHGTTNKHEDVEMGNLQKPAMVSTTHLPQHQGYSEADSHPVTGPHEVPTGYTGPDFGAGAGVAQHQYQYTGPDFSTPPQHPQSTGYSAYAPSESTRYEPSHANDPQELGTTYSNTLPPPSPSAQQTGFGEHAGDAPAVLQAGRRPGQQGGGGAWRDV